MSPLAMSLLAAAVLSGEPEPGTASVVLDSAGLEDDLAQRLEAEVQARIELLFTAHDYVEAPDASRDPTDLTLRILVEVPAPGEPIALITAVALDGRGQVLAERREVVCMRCDADELAAQSLAVLSDELLDVARGSAAPAVQSQSQPQSQPPSPPPPSSSETAPRPSVSPMLITGISVGALGLAGAISGAVLLYRGNEPIVGEPNLRDFRPAGATAIAVGLGAMVVGQVLIGVDRRRGHRARVTGVGLDMGATASLTIRGEF